MNLLIWERNHGMKLMTILNTVSFLMNNLKKQQYQGSFLKLYQIGTLSILSHTGNMVES